MPKYDTLRKTKRDKEIRRYSEKHPDYSHQEIANKFSISRSRVTQILNTQN